MTDIDKLGEEVAAQIKSAEADRVKIAPGLCRVWAELEAKRPVNGVKTKGAWAEKFGITLRYCQYLVKDGDRTNQKKANSVRIAGFADLDKAKGVIIGGVQYTFVLKMNRDSTAEMHLTVVRDAAEMIHFKPKGSTARNCGDKKIDVGFESADEKKVTCPECLKKAAKPEKQVTHTEAQPKEGDSVRITGALWGRGEQAVEFVRMTEVGGAVVKFGDRKRTFKPDVWKRRYIGIASSEKEVPEKAKLHIKLTKAQGGVLEDVFSGSMMDDSDALRDNLSEYRSDMDDAAFDAWIKANYIDVVALVGNSLIFDTSKPLWRVVARDTVDNVWNLAETDWADARVLEGEMPALQAAGIASSRRKCCENVAQKITLVLKDNCPTEENPA
jgi:hypothetical protein